MVQVKVCFYDEYDELFLYKRRQAFFINRFLPLQIYDPPRAGLNPRRT